jgi:hypothetical protein
MPDEMLEAQVFSENLDRILAGMGSQDENLQADLKSALQFSARMQGLRPSPDARFASKLKSSLLQKLAAQDAAAKDNWFSRFFPHEPVWQMVTVLAVIIIAGVSVWAAVLRPGASPPVVNLPVTTAPATTSAPTTAAPATTTAAVTATAAPSTTPAATSYAPGTYLIANASTDKSVYKTGEPVRISVELKNVSSQPFLLAQFPPILSLMTADSQPVYTFAAGQSQITLAAGQTASFSQPWNQTYAQGGNVAAGTYYLELEDIQFQGQNLKLNLQQPVSFTITY